MKDSIDIRRLVERRLHDLGLDAAEVSRELGFNRGYLSDYCQKESPKVMAIETKIALAEKLQIPAEALGVPRSVIAARVSHPAGFDDDAEPYIPGANFAIPPPHIATFKVKGNALDQHPRGIKPGRIIGINLNDVDPAHIRPVRL